MNKTRKLLPMSPVRTVTYVPGCSAKGWRGEAEPYPELGEGVTIPLRVNLP